MLAHQEKGLLCFLQSRQCLIDHNMNALPDAIIDQKLLRIRKVSNIVIEAPLE